MRIQRVSEAVAEPVHDAGRTVFFMAKDVGAPEDDAVGDDQPDEHRELLAGP